MPSLIARINIISNAADIRLNFTFSYSVKSFGASKIISFSLPAKCKDHAEIDFCLLYIKSIFREVLVLWITLNVNLKWILYWNDGQGCFSCIQIICLQIGIPFQWWVELKFDSKSLKQLEKRFKSFEEANWRFIYLNAFEQRQPPGFYVSEIKTTRTAFLRF